MLFLMGGSAGSKTSRMWGLVRNMGMDVSEGTACTILPARQKEMFSYFVVFIF